MLTRGGVEYNYMKPLTTVCYFCARNFQNSEGHKIKSKSIITPLVPKILG